VSPKTIANAFSNWKADYDRSPLALIVSEDDRRDAAKARTEYTARWWSTDRDVSAHSRSATPAMPLRRWRVCECLLHVQRVP
jgi:hypothetical protein